MLSSPLLSGQKQDLKFRHFTINDRFSQSKVAFERITTKDGLSQSCVHCIIQDKKGFMWFATYDGLNKYDGYTFKVYRNNVNDKTSLSHNEVRYLYEDNEGFIWVVSMGSGGLNKFNPKTDKFTRYRPVPGDSTSISSDEVYHVMQDISGQIWVCTLNALNLVINKQKGNEITTTFKRFYYTSNLLIRMIYEDRDGRLLLFADYLYYFDKKINKIIKTNTVIDTVIPPPIGIQSVSADKFGNLWLGTGANGIIKLHYNEKTKSYEKVGLNKINVTPINRNFLLIDDKDRIWIGTESKGLFQYNEKDKPLN